METLDPQGGASLDPRGLIGKIYVGVLWTLLHTKYKSCGPHGFREEVVPIISLWELYVAMATRGPSQSARKPYAVFPPT